MKFKDFPELRILAILGIITLGWHLLGLFSSFLGLFADLFILLILSWVLAFILEPLVVKISSGGIPRIAAAIITYLALAAGVVLLVLVVLPTMVTQFSQLATLVPAYLPDNSFLSARVESFLSTTANNSLVLASGVATTATNLLLILILSFYFLISRKEISKFFLDIIPDEYEEDYLFLEKTLNQTFASFIQIQVVLGLLLGLITLLTLVILNINFALSTALLSGILAMIPVVGSVIFVIPIILAGLTVSVQKMIIAVIVVILAAQLVYNLVAPKLMGTALKIHPIIVLLSFLIGYKLAGVWGAIFAIPVTSALAIIGKDLLKYWKEEADR
ncbi:AI-2E family transporter [Patescibacteria group bacterium]|nr:AI-2E family transporter [Patescibacteria group bacterium]